MLFIGNRSMCGNNIFNIQKYTCMGGKEKVMTILKHYIKGLHFRYLKRKMEVKGHKTNMEC